MSIILEANQQYENIIEKLFKNTNKGSLKNSGIARLIKQIKSNRIRYCGFPEWVIKSWLEPSQLGALPLFNNRWLNTQFIINSSNEIDAQDIIFSGFVVDGDMKQESGMKAISLSRSYEIDEKKYKQLLLFKLAANKAKKIIEKMENAGIDLSVFDKSTDEDMPEDNMSQPMMNEPNMGEL